jgi:sec-independent protein translocase protein TatA
MRFGTQELLIVLLIVLLIFGARKLPELARSLGASAKEFRKGIEAAAEEEREAQTAESTEVSDQ